METGMRRRLIRIKGKVLIRGRGAFVAAAAVTSIVGCGSTENVNRPKRPAATDRVEQPPKRSTKPSLLKRRGLPPAGVERQVVYGAAGDSFCVPKTRPQIIFDRRGFPPPAEGEDGGFPPISLTDEPEIGERFAICPSGFDMSRPVRVAVTDPAGKTQKKQLPPKDPNISSPSAWDWSPRPGDPLGEYRVEAAQDGRTATRTFRLHPASKPNVRILPTDQSPQPGHDIRVMLMGFRPRERVRMNLYTSSPDQSDYSYANSVLVRVATDGSTVYAVPTSRDDPRGCGVVRVETSAGPLDDGFCLGFE